MKTFKFEKEQDNKWYVVLPEWTGCKEELEMVRGADTMLDILAQGESETSLIISEDYFENSSFTLTFDKEEDEGGWYRLKGKLFEFDVWLCHVTKFVFGGYLPDKLYCN